MRLQRTHVLENSGIYSKKLLHIIKTASPLSSKYSIVIFLWIFPSNSTTNMISVTLGWDISFLAVGDYKIFLLLSLQPAAFWISFIKNPTLLTLLVEVLGTECAVNTRIFILQIQEITLYTLPWIGNLKAYAD